MKNVSQRGILLILPVLVIFSSSILASPFSKDDVKQLLIEEAQYQGMSPSMILAMAKVESDFNPSAISHAGAKGVMQIMPATAKNGFQVEEHELFNAKVNIRIGVAFIKQLLQQYDQRLDIALSHYNGGSRVKQPSGELAVIPATQAYVNKVQMHAQHYAKQGYDDKNGFVLAATALGRKNNPRLNLSYAQQIALDALDYDEMAMQSFASLWEKRASSLRPPATTAKPRISHLQDLRVHNLTRLLPAKPSEAKIMPAYAVTNTGSAQNNNQAPPLGSIRGPKASPLHAFTGKAEAAIAGLPSSYEPLTRHPAAELPAIHPQFVKRPAAERPVLELARTYLAPNYESRSYPTTNTPLASPQRGNKHKQVASWEAIFN